MPYGGKNIINSLYNPQRNNLYAQEYQSTELHCILLFWHVEEPVQKKELPHRLFFFNNIKKIINNNSKNFESDILLRPKEAFNSASYRNYFQGKFIKRCNFRCRSTYSNMAFIYAKRFCNFWTRVSPFINAFGRWFPMNCKRLLPINIWKAWIGNKRTKQMGGALLNILWASNSCYKIVHES